MRDAEVKGYLQGSMLGIQPYYLVWGSMWLAIPISSWYSLCISRIQTAWQPQGQHLFCPSATALTQQQFSSCFCVAHAWRAALGLPSGTELEECCGFRVENHQFSVIFCEGQWVFGIDLFTTFSSGLSTNSSPVHAPTTISDAFLWMYLVYRTLLHSVTLNLEAGWFIWGFKTFHLELQYLSAVTGPV